MVSKIGTAHADELVGGESDDNLYGLQGADTLSGGAGNDVLYDNDLNLVDRAADWLRGELGNDYLFGSPRDHFDGGDGSDLATIFTSGGNFFFDFSALSTDRGVTLDLPGGGSIVDVERVTVIAGNADDEITGTWNNDRLEGAGGADLLAGGRGVDVVLGQAGNDFLYGGGGSDDDDLVADQLIGGLGNDQYYVGIGDSVEELANGGRDAVVAAFSYTLGANVEVLQLTGVAISGAGNELANNIFGNDLKNKLFGNEGGDSLWGLDGADTLNGGADNDTLDGGSGDDVMRGGAGHDAYYVNSASDVVVELANAGRDGIFSSVAFTLPENVEDLSLEGLAQRGTGNEFDNSLRGYNDAVSYRLIGLGGTDILYGAAADDRLVGGEGDDWLDGLGGLDLLLGGAGDDHLTGDSVGDVLNGSVGNDEYWITADATIVEASGVDTVRADFSYTLGAELENLIVYDDGNVGTGNAAGNHLFYSGLNGTLRGLGGNDVLGGNFGNDVLVGGGGADQFVLSVGRGVDDVRDFKAGVDELLLYTEVSSLVIGDAEFCIGTTATTVDHRVIYDDATGALYYDFDGTGAQAQIQIATLTAHLALTADDIV